MAKTPKITQSPGKPKKYIKDEYDTPVKLSFEETKERLVRNFDDPEAHVATLKRKYGESTFQTPPRKIISISTPGRSSPNVYLTQNQSVNEYLNPMDPQQSPAVSPKAPRLQSPFQANLVTPSKMNGEDPRMKTITQSVEKLYRRDAQSGDVKALLWCAQHYRQLQSYTESLHYYERAVDRGHYESYYDMGVLLHTVMKDQERAKFCYEKVLLHHPNHADALVNLGLIFNDQTFRDFNPKLAVHYFEESLKNNPLNCVALQCMACAYYKGQGLPKSYQLSLTFAKRVIDAAQPGDAKDECVASDAMIGIGHIYYNGYDVKQDYVKALEWFQRAANLKNPRAYLKLARMYNLGLGVTMSGEWADYWNKKYVSSK